MQFPKSSTTHPPERLIAAKIPQAHNNERLNGLPGNPTDDIILANGGPIRQRENTA
jgi:hypothetical protein